MKDDETLVDEEYDAEREGDEPTSDINDDGEEAIASYQMNLLTTIPPTYIRHEADCGRKQGPVCK